MVLTVLILCSSSVKVPRSNSSFAKTSACSFSNVAKWFFLLKSDVESRPQRFLSDGVVPGVHQHQYGLVSLRSSTPMPSSYVTSSTLVSIPRLDALLLFPFLSLTTWSGLSGSLYILLGLSQQHALFQIHRSSLFVLVQLRSQKYFGLSYTAPEPLS